MSGERRSLRRYDDVLDPTAADKAGDERILPFGRERPTPRNHAGHDVTDGRLPERLAQPPEPPALTPYSARDVERRPGVQRRKQRRGIERPDEPKRGGARMGDESLATTSKSGACEATTSAAMHPKGPPELESIAGSIVASPASVTPNNT
jgi:hypothetical protein